MWQYSCVRFFHFFLVMASFALNTSFATDDAPNPENNIRFSYFRDLSPQDYLEKCMPHLSDEQRSKILPVYRFLLSQTQTPILEDNEGKEGPQNLGRILYESGYSFPPIPTLQGPFLLACSTLLSCSVFHKANILNIGPGRGDDTIMACLAGAHVINVDIHEKQIQELQQFVNSQCKGFGEIKFSVLKRDFSDPQVGIPPKYVGKIDAIIHNKVFHFLDDEQTKTMIKNMYALLKDGKLAFVTVSMPPPDSAQAHRFTVQKEAGEETPGLMYYEERRELFSGPLGTQRASDKTETVVLLYNRHNLPNPGYKVEKIKTEGTKHFLSMAQGRHYHDLETITHYLTPYFEILDSIVYPYDSRNSFLSIIIKKRNLTEESK